jgi:CRP-like cAMP-binding protein
MHGAAPADLLATDRLFAQLPPPARSRLLAVGMPRVLEAGQRIVARDQPHTGLYCLLEGTVHVMNPPHAGQEFFLLSLDGPAWFSEAGLFDGGRHSHDVCTRTRCLLLFFPREPLLRVLEGDATLWLWLGKLLAAKLRLSFFVLDELSPMAIETRLARHLLLKAAAFGASTRCTRCIHVQQEQLAQAMGLARASITPVLRDWRQRSLVDVRYGRILLLDIEQLKAIGGVAEWPSHYRELLDALH